MRTLLAMVILLLASRMLAFAQQPMGGATPSPEVQNLLTQLHTVGCNAEEQAAANTIAQLQKENASLKQQIQKLDPPKSGATKH